MTDDQQSQPRIDVEDVFPPEERQKHHLVAHIEPTAGEGTSVVLGGIDLTANTHGLDLSSRAGQGTQAVILLRVGAVVDFDGLADVTVVQQYQEADPAEISAWLSRIDPKSLEEAALQRFDLESGKPHGLAEAMMRQLVEWAAGKV